jgi:hypothetical protein
MRIQLFIATLFCSLSYAQLFGLIDGKCPEMNSINIIPNCEGNRIKNCESDSSCKDGDKNGLCCSDECGNTNCLYTIKQEKDCSYEEKWALCFPKYRQGSFCSLEECDKERNKIINEGNVAGKCYHREWCDISTWN